jgi:hypothetical protein
MNKIIGFLIRRPLINACIRETIRAEWKYEELSHIQFYLRISVNTTICENIQMTYLH